MRALIVLLVVLVIPSVASARTDESRLLELVAKVSFNEAMDSYSDLAMIWQIVEASAPTSEGRFGWLRRHSPCVSGVLTQDQAYERPGNCRWSRNLMPDGRRPRGWIRERDGHWSRTRVRWLRHLEAVREFVRGSDPYRPCVETPVTWDGRTWLSEAMSRGWEPIFCDGNPRNVGFIREGANEPAIDDWLIGLVTALAAP